MRILCVGDIHFRFELPYSSSFANGRKGELEKIKKLIHDEAKSCEAIVLLGDGFNARHNHSSVIKEFVDFLNGFGDTPIHILVGNHERYGNSTALDFLKEIKGKWNIYSEPTLTEIGGKQVMMIPYVTPGILKVETKEESVEKIFYPADASKGKIPLAFAHHMISGTKIRGVSMDAIDEIILPKDEMEKRFETVFSGHVHEKQRLSDKIIMTGSVMTHEVGEHSKSIWVYNDGDVTEIPLPVRPIHKIVWGEHESVKITKNSIVKCYVKDRSVDIEDVKDFLSGFDASLLIEQYPSKREKTHFEEGAIDFSMESLLKSYAKAKKIEYKELQEGFELISHTII